MRQSLQKKVTDASVFIFFFLPFLLNITFCAVVIIAKHFTCIIFYRSYFKVMIYQLSSLHLKINTEA